MRPNVCSGCGCVSMATLDAAGGLPFGRGDTCGMEFCGLCVRDRVKLWEWEFLRRQQQVEEYRIRYAKLEAALAEQSALEASIADTESQSPNAFSLDLDTALIRLEQEKNRSYGLTQINNALREQLETATDVNQTLTSDVQRLTREWQSARAELLSKESEWKEEEQTFSFYFSKESNLLLKLWREVLDFKRDFSALKRFTERELSSFQGSMGHGMQSMHEVQRALASRLQGSDTTDRAYLLPQILSSGITYEKSESAEVARLQNMISDLTVQNDRIQQLLDDKEKSSTLLCSVVEKMNEAFNQPVSLSHPTVVNSQQERLCNQYSKAFEDIFQVLLEEGNCDISSLISVEESSSLSFGSAFGPLQLQSIVSAVKKSMQKYNKQVEEYKLQLASSKEQNLMHQRTIEFLEDERQKGQQVNTRLSSQNESLNLQMKEMFQEMKSKDIGKQSEALEAAVKSLNEQLENARVEQDHLTKLKEELYSKLQAANDEKRTLRHSEQTLTWEKERSSQMITSLEKTIETLKKDYQASQESLHKTSLARDLLEQDKSKFTTDLTNLKQQFFEQNQWLKDLKEKYTFMEDSLATLQAQTESLALEKADLSKAYDKVTTELESLRSSHSNAKLEFEQEKLELKLQVEQLQERATELEAERDRLKEQLLRAEESRQGVEDERSEISIRNNDLINQVTQYSSQKQSLEQELEEVRRELTTALEELAQSEQGVLDHTRSSELASQLAAAEAETERLREELEALGEEKAQLEEKTILAARELAERSAEKGDVERELDGLRATTEALKAQIKGLEELHEKYVNDSAKERNSLLLKMQEIEQVFQLSLKNKDEQHNIEIENLTQEKAALRNRMVTAIDELFEQNQKQQDELLTNHQEEVASLKKEISAHRREYEDKILLLEEERKKIHSDYKAQISSYEEKIQKLKKELDQKEELIGQLEEKISATDREKETWLRQYNEEMQSLKEELSSWSSKHSNEISNIQKKMSSLQQEKETALSDLRKLELHLKETEAERNKMSEELEEKNANYSNEKSFKAILEDKLTSLQAQLSNEQNQSEVVNKLLEDCKDRLKVAVKENSELKRQLDEAQQEIKDKEASLSKVQSQNGELKSTLLEVEKSRQELKREVHGLKRTVSSQEKSLKSKDQEISDLNALHAREEEIQEGLKKEIVALRQKTLEWSASSEALSKELSSCKQRCGELEHKLQLQREQHRAQLEEWLSSERGLSERRLGLERSVSEASREIHGLRSGLSWEEGKVLALETKIAKLDGSKREVENKLFSICVFLRSLLGLGSDSGFLSNLPPNSSFQRSASSERLLGSPQRPNRSVQFSASDMDVELLKTSLTDFVHRADAAEKERAELKDVIARLQKEEAALRAEHSQCASTIYQLKRAWEDKKILEEELASNVVRVTRSEEAIRTLEREKKRLSEKVDGAEFLSSAACKEKEALQAKLFEMKKTRAKLQEEVSSLQAARESAENRALKYIKAYQNVEADLLSAKDALGKRDGEAKSLQQEVTALTKKLKSSERQVKSLQWDLDNLREQSERLAENEKRLKQQVSSMSATVSQTSASQQSLHEELERKKQENLANQEKLLTFMQVNNQLRDQGVESWSKYEALLNQTKELQKTLAQEEVARKDLQQQVEKHKSMLLASQKVEKEAELEVERLEREKRSLEERMRSLSTTLRSVQEENQLSQSVTKEAKSLTEKLEKEKARSSDLSAKLKEAKSSFRDSMLKIETENQRLLIRIQNLQAQLAEMEERHSQRVKEFLSVQSSESRLQESSLKKALRQTQELMKAKEKTHRQKILGLEEQIRVLQSHIESELQRSRELGRRSRGASSSIGHLQSVLSHSLHCVSEDPHQLLPEAERLDQATEAELSVSGGELHLDTPSRLRRRPASLPRTSTPKASSFSSKS